MERKWRGGVQRCETCRFFDESPSTDGRGEITPEDETGRYGGLCVRYPPTITEADLRDEEADGDVWTNCRFPQVWQYQWCGEWQPVKEAP